MGVPLYGIRLRYIEHRDYFTGNAALALPVSPPAGFTGYAPGGPATGGRRAHTSGVDELPAEVQGLLDAANDGDLESFLDSFTPDGIVDDWGRVFEGRTAITEWSDAEFIGQNVSLDVTAVSVRADDWTIAAQVGGDGFTGVSHFTFRVKGDGVARMTIRE